MNALVKRTLWKILPRGPSVNWLFAAPYFHRYHRRLPLDSHSPQAGLEDYIFSRMIGRFTPWEESCVDKETAKSIALGLAPNVKMARVEAVMKLSPRTRAEEVEAFLAPFWGKPLVAKPTNGSGGSVFLDSPRGALAAEALSLLRLARQNYFFHRFEVQYRRLAPKILVEESIGRPSPPDFRFWASRGRLYFCQYNEGAPPDLRQAFFTVPDYSPIFLPSRYRSPISPRAKPPHWDAMLSIASQLSAPFDLVRVDLYDLPQGVYFGEFTLTPNASELPFRDPAFSRRCLREMRAHLRSIPENL